MKKGPATSSILGNSSQDHWGQVFVSRGGYGVIEVKDAKYNAQEYGILLLTRLTRLLSDPPKSLNDVEIMAHDLMSPYVVSLVLFVPVEQVAYVVILGSGSVFLRRGPHVSCLLERTGSISGEMKHDDVLILFNQSATHAVHSAGTTLFNKQDVYSLAEKVTVYIHKDTEKYVAAAGLLYQPVATQPTNEHDKEPDVPFSGYQETDKQKRSVNVSIKHILQKLKAAMRFVRLQKLKEQPVRIKILISVFISFFLVSVGLGVYKQASNTSKKRIIAITQEARFTYEEAVALFELNALKGRDKLEQAKAMLEPLVQTVSKRTPEGREVRLLYEEIDAYLTMAKQEFTVDPQLFYDLALATPNGSISSMNLYEDSLFLLNRGNNALYTFSIASKNIQAITDGSKFDNPQYIAPASYEAYVYDKEGIKRVDLEEGDVTLVIRPSDDWGSIQSMQTFAGNIYLLDKTHSRIWKYIATDAGFSELREYLNPDTLPDFTDATAMAIDGSVWVGSDNGELYKFTQGQKTTFREEGLEKALGKSLVVYTDDQLQRVYVYDKENARVVRFDKDGVYIDQYVFTTSKEYDSLVASEELQLIVLLADGKLYSFSTK